MPFANFKVPAGTLNAQQKEEIVHQATELYVQIYGERARATTMILIDEVPDGGWGIGDHVLTLAMLQHSDTTAETTADTPSGTTASTPAGTPGNSAGNSAGGDS